MRGITRLSIGVQSFDDRFLGALGRVHNGAQARAAVQEAAESVPASNLDIRTWPGNRATRRRNGDAYCSSAQHPHLPPHD